MLAICLCGLGHERSLAAADARTLEHLQDPVRRADVDLRHRAQHLLRGAGLGTRSFFGQVLIPVNMIMGGVTTFFLGQTTDFVTLCFLFVMLSLW